MTQIRLIAAVVLALVISGLLGWVWLERKTAADAVADAATARAQTQQLLTINEQQAAVNAQLANQRVIDDRVVNDLGTKLDAIQQAADTQTQAMRELKDADPEAKSWLDTDIPPGVLKLRSR